MLSFILIVPLDIQLTIRTIAPTCQLLIGVIIVLSYRSQGY